VFLQNSGRIAPRDREVVFRTISVIARSEATKQSSYPLCREMDCFASLAMTGLENEQRQLIKRIGDFEADQNQRGDHQIKAEMHEGLETKYFCGLRDLAKDANQIHCVSGHASVRRYRRM
jgi:hypothetical protein